MRNRCAQIFILDKDKRNLIAELIGQSHLVRLEVRLRLEFRFRFRLMIK